jgi:hypothetical protein
MPELSCSIFFHAAVIDLFRPLHVQYDSKGLDLSIPSDRRLFKLKSFSSADSSTSTISAASEHQLQRLLLLYRAAFPSAEFSILWQTAPLYVANAAIRDARFAKGLHDAQEIEDPFSSVVPGPENLQAVSTSAPSLVSVVGHASAVPLGGHASHSQGGESVGARSGARAGGAGVARRTSAASSSSSNPSGFPHRNFRQLTAKMSGGAELSMRDVSWRKYLWICLAAYARLAKPYRIVVNVVRGLLAMALAAEALRSDEAGAIMREVRRQCEEGPEGADMDMGEESSRAEDERQTVRERREGHSDRLHASFVVDLDLAMRDRMAAQVQVIADKFEDLTMFDEFIVIDEQPSAVEEEAEVEERAKKAHRKRKGKEHAR